MPFSFGFFHKKNRQGRARVIVHLGSWITTWKRLFYFCFFRQKCAMTKRDLVPFGCQKYSDVFERGGREGDWKEQALWDCRWQRGYRGVHRAWPWRHGSRRARLLARGGASLSFCVAACPEGRRPVSGTAVRRSNVIAVDLLGGVGVRVRHAWTASAVAFGSDLHVRVERELREGECPKRSGWGLGLLMTLLTNVEQ